MSTIQDRIGFMDRMGRATQSLILALGDTQSGGHVPPSTPNTHDASQLVKEATILKSSDGIYSSLVSVGIEHKVAGDLAAEFDRLLEPLYTSAQLGLTQACSRIVSQPSSPPRPSHQELVSRLVLTLQATYDSQVREIKAAVLEQTRSCLSSSSHFSGAREYDIDEESVDGDDKNDDPDSDSEEAVKIEQYYPVLEEMFLKGVERPSRDEKLKLSEHTGIPYYNLGIWFQNRRDRGPHAGKGEWMRKYAEGRSITPAPHVSSTDEAETDDSASDHGMSEFDEDEWETDPEEVLDLNLLELGPPAPHLLAFPISSPSRQSFPMPKVPESDSTPSTPFASSSRSISFESSSDSFSYSDVSFVSAGPSVYTGSPSPLLEPSALLPSLISRAQVPSESQIHESSVTFGQLPTPMPSMSFLSSISPSFATPPTRFGTTHQMRGNTPSTGPSTPPGSSFGFDFGPTVPFGNSSRPNIPGPNLGLSPSINEGSPSQGAPQTPLMTFRPFNFEFSLTPSPTQGKFNDVDLSFGSFDIAPYSSAASFFDSFNANSDTSSSDSASDYASPDPQQADPLSRAASPLPPRSIILDFASVNENNWRPVTPEPSELDSREDAVESKLLAAAASVVSRNLNQQPHNPSPFKLAPHHPISPRPASPLMEPLFPLSSPLRDASPIPSPTSPVMGVLPFLNHALRPPARVDELAAYANVRVEKSSLPVPLAAEREGLDEPSPLALTRHLELGPEPTPPLSLFDVLKEPPVPVVDKAMRDRVNDFLKRYCAGRNGSSDETQLQPASFPRTSPLPTASTFTTVPQDTEAI